MPSSVTAPEWIVLSWKSPPPYLKCRFGQIEFVAIEVSAQRDCFTDPERSCLLLQSVCQSLRLPHSSSLHSSVDNTCYQPTHNHAPRTRCLATPFRPPGPGSPSPAP